MDKKGQAAGCRIARNLQPWLWFIKHPWLGSLLVFALSWLIPLIGYIEEYTVRVFLAWLAAVVTTLLAYVPFLTLLTAVVIDLYRCQTIPAPYLLFIFYALQFAHQNLAYAVYVGDEPRAYSSVCGAVEPDPLDCVVGNRPWWIYFRFWYYSAVTFVSVGYGDISPQTFLGTAVTFPLLWSPVFFLGILLGKIIGSSGQITQRNFASFS